MVWTGSAPYWSGYEQLAWAAAANISIGLFPMGFPIVSSSLVSGWLGCYRAGGAVFDEVPSSALVRRGRGPVVANALSGLCPMGSPPAVLAWCWRETRDV